MNTKKYIESGILEDYLLGISSEQEQKEVESLAKIYPEIKEELDKLSRALEYFAMSYQKVPPPHLKTKIMAAIKNIETESSTQIVSSPYIDNNTKIHKNDPFKWLAAAAIALLLITVALYQNMKMQLNNANAQIAALGGANENIEGELNTVRSNYASLNNQLAIVSHCKTRIRLENMNNVKAPCCLMLYCMDKTKEMYVQINKLKPAPEGTLYQLWAIKDNKPVDLGQIEPPKDSFAFRTCSVYRPSPVVCTHSRSQWL